MIPRFLHLKEIRLRKGFSGIVLCDQVGIERSSLYRYETGLSFPDIRIAFKISNALQVRIQDIWDLEEEKETK